MICDNLADEHLAVKQDLTSSFPAARSRHLPRARQSQITHIENIMSKKQLKKKFRTMEWLARHAVRETCICRLCFRARGEGV